MNWTLVTGSAKGLGSAICLELAERKMPVVIHYNTSKEEALLLQEQCREKGTLAEIIQGDFSTPLLTQSFLDRYLKAFPDTKHLINNVGNYVIDSFLNTPADLWNDLYQVNVFSPIQLMLALVPSINRLKGSIVNLGVVGIQSVPADTYATLYTSSKLSLWMATKSLAKELLPTGVRVNMVSPGYLENAVDLPEDLSKLPQKRAVALSETARLIAFLLDEKSSSITGQNIEIAGGVRL